MKYTMKKRRTGYEKDREDKKRHDDKKRRDDKYYEKMRSDWYGGKSKKRKTRKRYI